MTSFESILEGVGQSWAAVVPVVNVGAGYRLLGPDEVMIENDEAEHHGNGIWLPMGKEDTCIGRKCSKWPALRFRRRVKREEWYYLKPGEIRQEGDEVCITKYIGTPDEAWHKTSMVGVGLPRSLSARRRIGGAS